MILFTRPSAVSVTAAKWIDSWVRLQFRFFPNLFSCLLIINLSRTNNRSPQDRKHFRRNSNRQWIPITFHVYSRYLAARDVHSTATGCQWFAFQFFDHDATQSERAHRLVVQWSVHWAPSPMTRALVRL